MGEKETEPFQFTFNGFLKVAFQGSRVTSDAGLILVRELDERLGLEAIITEHLSDSRQGLNTQFRLPDLLRQSIYLTMSVHEPGPRASGDRNLATGIQRGTTEEEPGWADARPLRQEAGDGTEYSHRRTLKPVRY